MSYIWEEKNRGISLYEKAILEAEDDAAGKNDAAVQEKPPSAEDGTTPANLANSDESKDKTQDNDKVLQLIRTYPEQFRAKLALLIKDLEEGKWLDGSKIDSDEKKRQAFALLKAVKAGNADVVHSIARNIANGKIKVDAGNTDLYRAKEEKSSITAKVRIPSMFDSEPDDSMWDEMVVNDFGMPLVNLGHPAVSKIIKSEKPEEECPEALKHFKKAIYGDKRLTAVFGEGGIARMLGKMANLLTLGIAGATVDAGKRADRIIKELQEKGGRIAHRNLLSVSYKDIIDADPDNPDQTVEARAYYRGKKVASQNTMEVPVSAIAQFYSVVDPIKSAKVYLEYMVARGIEPNSVPKAESAEADSPALVEGPISAIAGAARKVQDVFGEKATAPKKQDGDAHATLKQKYIEYINEHGHPWFYILKPKSDNHEVDVISSSKTAQAGTSGSKVHMVTIKVGDHKAAAFMTPAEIEFYFSAT